MCGISNAYNQSNACNYRQFQFPVRKRILVKMSYFHWSRIVATSSPEQFLKNSLFSPSSYSEKMRWLRSWHCGIKSLKKPKEQLISTHSNLTLAMLTGKNLNSVEEFVKIKFWLLLIFSTCLQNQLFTDVLR